MAVSYQVKPNKTPAIGPLKNLIAVAKITVKYLPNDIFLGLRILK